MYKVYTLEGEFVAEFDNVGEAINYVEKNSNDDLFSDDGVLFIMHNNEVVSYV